MINKKNQKIALISGDTDSAIKFYKQAQERVPLPETAIALGDIYTKLGRAGGRSKKSV
jgi:hypothetical protein